MPSGGEQNREGYTLVPCQGCRGNVRLKVEEHMLMATEPKPQGKVEQKPLKKWVQPAQLVIVENIYHRAGGDGERVQKDYGHKYNRDLFSKEQVWERQMTATSEAKPLELGWIKRCGLLMIRNDSKGATLVLEPGDYLVLPGESMRVHPRRPEQMTVRTESGEADLLVVAIPA
jgi:hypothetical protein